MLSLSEITSREAAKCDNVTAEFRLKEYSSNRSVVYV